LVPGRLGRQRNRHVNDQNPNTENSSHRSPA
jgi:hypothetical protein